ncbi:MAG TPA: hypothetical protein PKA38_02320 [Candidatus Levybacteria bacterium]|nr:hypothetical protein [Candidatus Levybacteria bacterium]
MASPELNPLFKQTLQAIPSIFELKDRHTRNPEELKAVQTTLPLSINEFADITTPLGAPIVGRLDTPGVYEIEAGAWYPDPNNPAFLLPQFPIANGLARIQLKDLGDKIETSLWNAHVVRRELLGNPPPTDTDIELLYKLAFERNSPEELPFLALSDNITFGDFIENYPIRRHEYEPDTDDEITFLQEKKRVILRPDFYTDLERFLKRKGIVRECDALSPVALYHEKSGLLSIGDEGDYGIHEDWIDLGWHLSENPGVVGLYKRVSDTTTKATLNDPWNFYP